MTFDQWMETQTPCSVGPSCKCCQDMRRGWDLCHEINVKPLVEMCEAVRPYIGGNGVGYTRAMWDFEQTLVEMGHRTRRYIAEKNKEQRECQRNAESLDVKEHTPGDFSEEVEI